MIQDYLKGQTQLINMYLEQYIPKGEPKILFDAIEYSLKAGGKRIRPILVLESAKTLKEDIDIKNFIDIAISTEFIHTYSLIHDDLPAMDDDDLRRGKPTCHKQFSEAIAILAGDGLLTYAFELISLNKNLSAEKLLKIINILSHNVGIYGMVGGQAGDILEDFKDIDFIHLNKTAKFIQACCQIGAVIADATPEEEDKLKNYGKHIGIAFQIWDDLLDEIGDPSKLGKKVNKDKEKNKITYPSIYGIEKSKEMAYNHINQAISYIKDLKNPQILIQIAEFIVSREV
ncbi:polyprenyl synthetase family protein [Venenivibrio stagnispumantis]|uniref:Geranylgeranyl diphosphate synthase, type II n=1 Tax=Venenivibrio stagnispumantis TaxID=407998 RepID=A0AA45WKJ2_9AQUI|nr:farnesyl diphosphate synthase [Venenivibrio stagnispumantis]MCW4573468.1 polyprenyl synthetase family protein [Venenivibrio stagnispumantis]SMP06824.1 geranylgeranyl diphosphate synthase, type II [Venenivibrio stagnispumantis]